MFLTEFDESVFVSSRDTLTRLKDKKIVERPLMEVYSNISSKMDRGKDLFEPYDSISFEGKTKVDLLYYEQLLQKLEESLSPQVSTLIAKLYTNIREIYEFVNINPEIYGNKIDVKILNDSVEDTRRKLSKVIYEYLDNNFYKLEPKQRETRYYEKHKEIAKSLVFEGNSPEEAIEFSIKTVVIEGLLRHISFPFSSWSRINYLIENKEYCEIFDQPKLVELVESFEKKLRDVSKIIATCI